jgi:hypothetical protein
VNFPPFPQNPLLPVPCNPLILKRAKENQDWRGLALRLLPLTASRCGGRTNLASRSQTMSIQKKSLISALKTTKKANVASAPLTESGTPSAKNTTSIKRFQLKQLKATGFKSFKAISEKKFKSLK